jgi:hypothetical protein
MRVLKFVEAVGDAPEVHERGPAQRLDQRENRARRPILEMVAEGERRPQTAPTRSTEAAIPSPADEANGRRIPEARQRSDREEDASMTSRYEFRVPGGLSDRPLVAFPDMAVVEAAWETISTATACWR